MPFLSEPLLPGFHYFPINSGLKKHRERAPTRHLPLLYNWQTIFTIMRLVSLPPFAHWAAPLWSESVRGKRFRIQFMGRITWKATLCLWHLGQSCAQLPQMVKLAERNLTRNQFWPKAKLFSDVVLPGQRNPWHCPSDNAVVIRLCHKRLHISQGSKSIPFILFILITIWLVITVT